MGHQIRRSLPLLLLSLTLLTLLGLAVLYLRVPSPLMM